MTTNERTTDRWTWKRTGWKRGAGIYEAHGWTIAKDQTRRCWSVWRMKDSDGGISEGFRTLAEAKDAAQKDGRR